MVADARSKHLLWYGDDERAADEGLEVAGGEHSCRWVAGKFAYRRGGPVAPTP